MSRARPQSTGSEPIPIVKVGGVCPPPPPTPPAGPPAPPHPGHTPDRPPSPHPPSWPRAGEARVFAPRGEGGAGGGGRPHPTVPPGREGRGGIPAGTPIPTKVVPGDVLGHTYEI